MIQLIPLRRVDVGSPHTIYVNPEHVSSLEPLTTNRTRVTFSANDSCVVEGTVESVRDALQGA